MAESNALGAMNMQLQRGNGATPEVFTTIAEIKRLSFGVRTEMQETTHFQSPDDTKEKKAVIKELGDVGFDFNFVPTDLTQSFSAGLGAELLSMAAKNYRILFPDNTAWVIKGNVTALDITAEVGATIQGNAVITPTRSFVSVQ